MAGAVGVVPNRSGFASFVVRNWEAWMTECVILHMSGMSIPELRVRFGKTDAHLRNILNTEQANKIVGEVKSRALATATDDAKVHLQNIKSQALQHMSHFMTDEAGLRAERPFAFWDATRKTLETVSRLDAPAATPSSVTNIQQNILNASPEMLNRLRSTPGLGQMEIPTNVEYLGSPPPAGSAASAVLGRGVHADEGQSKNGLTLVKSSGPVSE